MSYTKVTNFAVKDGLPTGNPSKIVKGTEIDVEFNALQAESTAITAALASKQPIDATLTSLSALGTAANKLAYTTATDTWAETPLTAAARTVLDDVTVADMRTTLSAAISGSNSDITSLTGLSGNLSFTGTGNRITGDFSNATVANRAMFQTSTVNGSTTLPIIPNGTSVVSGVICFSGTDTGNSPYITAYIDGTASYINSSKTGTGTYLPTTFYTGDVERMRVTATGVIGIGTSSPSTYSSNVGSLVLNNSATSGTLTDNEILYIRSANRSASIVLDSQGTNGNNKIHGYTLGTIKSTLSFDKDGNITVDTANGGLGYGTGAGGTVTQATSKSTNVTLNKPTGQITMNNAALAAGATVSFQCANTLVGVSDLIIANIAWNAAANPISYSVSAASYNITPGTILFVVKNETGGSLSDALTINFAIIKGAIA